jgi:hypothetical protein
VGCELLSKGHWRLIGRFLRPGRRGACDLGFMFGLELLSPADRISGGRLGLADSLSDRRRECGIVQGLASLLNRLWHEPSSHRFRLHIDFVLCKGTHYRVAGSIDTIDAGR